MNIGDIMNLADGHKTTVVFVGNDYAISRCCHGDEFVWCLILKDDINHTTHSKEQVSKFWKTIEAWLTPLKAGAMNKLLFCLWFLIVLSGACYFYTYANQIRQAHHSERRGVNT